MCSSVTKALSAHTATCSGRDRDSLYLQLSQLHEKVPCLPALDHLLGQPQRLRASDL